ncbi:MAG: putative glycoside hydrolase, partial [bacterium]
MSARYSPFLALALIAACSASERAPNPPSAQGSALAVPSVPVAQAATPAPADPGRPAADTNRTVASIDVDKEFPIVRALYVNRFAGQSTKRMRQLIQIADETEINALVIDMKDEFGLNYTPANAEFRKNAGTSGTIRNLPALLDTLRAHKILPIARLVVFKDSVTARVHPEWTIRKQDGSVWRDKKGLAWVNPYHHELWDYNIGLAEELAKMG